MKSKNVAKMGRGYSYKDNIRGIKIPFVVQIYSFILSKRVRLVSYELSLSQMLLGREGGVFLIRRIIIYVCGGGGMIIYSISESFS